MGRYYAEHNQLTKACEEMSQQLDDILKALSGSGKHVVKILEIGAGLCDPAHVFIKMVLTHRYRRHRDTHTSTRTDSQDA